MKRISNWWTMKNSFGEFSEVSRWIKDGQEIIIEFYRNEAFIHDLKDIVQISHLLKLVKKSTNSILLDKEIHEKNQ